MSTGFCSVESVSAQARKVARPPVAPITYQRFAGTIKIPDGPLAGTRYDPSLDPAHACLCREMAAGWQRIVAVGAVQTGKSLATILVPLLRSLVLLRQPCVYSQPTLTKIQEGWAGKLAPSIRESGYGEWLPQHGQGARGGQTPKFVTFRDPVTGARSGTLYLIAGGGSSESAQSAVTAAVVAVDEVDSFQSRHRVELILKRADSYGSKALRILTSTVKSDDATGDGASIILGFYRESTASRLHFRCPHCEKFQSLEWERVTYEDENEPQAIATARYSCAHCAVAWTEDDRLRALRDWRCVHAGQSVDVTGSIIGEHPKTVAFGLLWTSLDSSLRQLGQLAAEHWRAKRSLAQGDHGPMRSFVRDQLCQGYQEPAPAGEITNAGLAIVSARSDYDKRTVPQWVHNLSVGVDVQGDRHYWLVVGFGDDDRAAIIDWGYEMLVPTGEQRQPTPADRRRLLHEMEIKFTRGWQIEGGDARMAPIAGQRGIDVGYVTDEIVGWLRGVQGWRAIKGAGKDHIKLGKFLELPPEAKSFVEVRQPDGWPIPLIHMQNDNVLRWCHAALLRDPYTPASMMLPRNLKSSDALLLHLSAEIETTDKDGHAYIRTDVHPRHDYLDCLKMAVSLSRLRRGIQSAKAARTNQRKYGNIGSVR